MLTFTNEEREQFGFEERPEPELNPETWKKVCLTLSHDGDNQVEVSLLGSDEWLADQQAEVGATVFLNMPEMSVEGEARVTAIEPCPQLDEGEGKLVTGTFRHTSGEIHELKVAGEEQPTGVTATHPFWSVDLQQWVSAADLKARERVRTLAGVTAVESIRKKKKLDSVYNVEVAGDHCYRIGRSGVLVHNASPRKDFPDFPKGSNVKKKMKNKSMRIALNLAWASRSGVFECCPEDPNNPDKNREEMADPDKRVVVAPGNASSILYFQGDSPMPVGIHQMSKRSTKHEGAFVANLAKVMKKGETLCIQIAIVFTEREPCDKCIDNFEKWVKAGHNKFQVVHFGIPQDTSSPGSKKKKCDESASFLVAEAWRNRPTNYGAPKTKELCPRITSLGEAAGS